MGAGWSLRAACPLLAHAQLRIATGSRGACPGRFSLRSAIRPARAVAALPCMVRSGHCAARCCTGMRCRRTGAGSCGTLGLACLPARAAAECHLVQHSSHGHSQRLRSLVQLWEWGRSFCVCSERRSTRPPQGCRLGGRACTVPPVCTQNALTWMTRGGTGCELVTAREAGRLLQGADKRCVCVSMCACAWSQKKKSWVR